MNNTLSTEKKQSDSIKRSISNKILHHLSPSNMKEHRNFFAEFNFFPNLTSQNPRSFKTGK